MEFFRKLTRKKGAPPVKDIGKNPIVEIDKGVETNAKVIDIFKSRNIEYVRNLGSGTYGQVLEMAKRDESKVAMKILTVKNVSDGEITYWPKLSHPNVLPVTETYFLTDIATYAFESPVHETSMNAMLSNAEFGNSKSPLARIKTLFTDILLGLQYMHSKQFAHLDLKADNVLVSSEMSAVLCDFSFIHSTTDPTTSYGVPYALRPPEALISTGDGQAPVEGAPVDMWTVGMLAINSLTGHVLRRKLESKPSSWSKDVYPSLYEVLKKSELQKYIEAAFPKAQLERGDLKSIRNFILMFLRLHPDERPTAERALDHEFLNRGQYTSEVDDIWAKKVSCSKIEIGISNYRIRLKSMTECSNSRRLLPNSDLMSRYRNMTIISNVKTSPMIGRNAAVIAAPAHETSRNMAIVSDSYGRENTTGETNPPVEVEPGSGVEANDVLLSVAKKDVDEHLEIGDTELIGTEIRNCEYLETEKCLDNSIDIGNTECIGTEVTDSKCLNTETYFDNAVGIGDTQLIDKEVKDSEGLEIKEYANISVEIKNTELIGTEVNGLACLAIKEYGNYDAKIGDTNLIVSEGKEAQCVIIDETSFDKTPELGIVERGNSKYAETEIDGSNKESSEGLTEERNKLSASAEHHVENSKDVVIERFDNELIMFDCPHNVEDDLVIGDHNDTDKNKFDYPGKDERASEICAKEPADTAVFVSEGPGNDKQNKEYPLMFYVKRIDTEVIQFESLGAKEETCMIDLKERHDTKEMTFGSPRRDEDKNEEHLINSINKRMNIAVLKIDSPDTFQGNSIVDLKQRIDSEIINLESPRDHEGNYFSGVNTQINTKMIQLDCPGSYKVNAAENSANGVKEQTDSKVKKFGSSENDNEFAGIAIKQQIDTKILKSGYLKVVEDIVEKASVVSVEEQTGVSLEVNNLAEETQLGSKNLEGHVVKVKGCVTENADTLDRQPRGNDVSPIPKKRFRRLRRLSNWIRNHAIQLRSMICA